jgi:ubiquinone/menaquinone biosynthesis C-methylase UbiE
MNGKLEAQKTWGASPTGWTSAKDEMPGTRAFFDKARAFRDTIEQPWLPEVVPFHEMAGKQILEIGFGPGYDTLKFMQAGAVYSGIDITPENVDRTRKHLGFFGYAPNVQQADAENLPFPDASFDIVYSNGVLHHVPDMQKAFREARRVLKPGGEFIILLYNRFSVFYVGAVLVHFLSGRFRYETLTQRRSKIESSTANAAPIVNVYSKREITKILGNQGFATKSIAVRKCTPEDLPGGGKLQAIYRTIPNAVYDALGRTAGWYLVIRAISRTGTN